jgi:hypothetical protein
MDYEMFGHSIRTLANSLFKTRSADRDAETDYSRVKPVFRSVGQALTAAQTEYSGLDNRMQDVLARASISSGNGSDEYLDRDPADTRLLNLFDGEILSGQRRLEELSQQIKSLKALEAALMVAFPDFKLRSE